LSIVQVGTTSAKPRLSACHASAIAVAWLRNNPDVRGALYAYHGRVCAYCQRELTDSDRGDVEHFRPKSFYPWLAYEFTNYFLGCARCNRVLKRQGFPIQLGKRRFEFAARQMIKREPRLLADPVNDPVEDWFEIDLDDEMSSWILCPSLSKNSIGFKRVQETVRFFRLNVTPDLITARCIEVIDALRLLNRWKKNEVASKTALEREIADRSIRFRIHGAAVRSVVRRVKRSLLPSPNHELSWLLRQFVARYQLYEQLLSKNGVSAEVHREIQFKQAELKWALAAL
jgi:uncharacterized protein (TIGR02646 family)